MECLESERVDAVLAQIDEARETDNSPINLAKSFKAKHLRCIIAAQGSSAPSPTLSISV